MAPNYRPLRRRRSVSMSEREHSSVLSPRVGHRARVRSSELRAMEDGGVMLSDEDEPKVTSMRQLRTLLRQYKPDPQLPQQQQSHRDTALSLQRDKDRRRRRRSDVPAETKETDPCSELLATLRNAGLPRSRRKLLWLFVALLGVLVVFDWAVESLVLRACGEFAENQDEPMSMGGWKDWLPRLATGDRQPDLAKPAVQIAEDSCSPSVLDVSKIRYSSQHRFYDLIKRRGTPKPPVFRDDLQVLCHSEARAASRFGYCLPIAGRTDEPFCRRPDRMDLLVTNSSSFCYASVLHMLLLDVYEELQRVQAAPIVAYGTLLGAVRNGTMIPYTEDADIGYVSLPPSKMDALRQRLWEKGYHLFKFILWRVCVAPTHPLAARLFAPDKGLTRNYKVPYVDMYEMQELADKTWSFDGTRDDSPLPRDKILPYSKVSINGLEFDTVADPIAFLVEEYGDDYMEPYQRPEKKQKANGFNFFEGFLEEPEEPGGYNDLPRQNQEECE